MQYGEKIKHYRKMRRLSQQDVAEYLSAQGYPIKKASYAHWEQDRTIPNADQLLLLCEYLHIEDPMETFLPDRQPLLNEIGLRKVEEYKKDLIASGLYKPNKKMKKRMCPLFLLPASAGTGQFLDSDNYEMVELSEEVPDGVDFGIKIAGDSMEPDFHNGDTAWVKKQDTINDGEIGVFYLDGDAYIKQFHQTENGIQLVSLNTAYKPIELMESSDFRVFGKVL